MKTLLVVIFLMMGMACSKSDDSESNNSNNNPPSNSCGTMSGYTLYKDDNGCYYSDSYGTKTYVNDDLCNC